MPTSYDVAHKITVPMGGFLIEFVLLMAYVAACFGLCILIHRRFGKPGSDVVYWGMVGGLVLYMTGMV